MTGIEPAYSAWEAVSMGERMFGNAWQTGRRDVKTTVTAYGHLINTEYHAGNIAALSALGNRISSENVVLQVRARR